MQFLGVVFPERRLFAWTDELEQLVLHEFEGHMNGLLQSMFVSFRTEQEHVNAFFSEPVEQTLLVKVVLDVNFVHFLENGQRLQGNFQAFADQARLKSLKEKFQAFFLIDRKKVQHNELQIRQDLILKHQNMVKRFLDSFNQQMRKVLIVVQEQVECVLRRKFEVF